MIVSPDILRRDLLRLMKQVDAQIKQVEDAATARGVQPEEIKDTNGSYAMTPLLLAKVQGIAALVQLNEQSKRK